MHTYKIGFTLTELLGVILIIGILAAIAMPMYEKSIFHSRFSNVQQTAQAIKQAEEMFFLSNGRYTSDFNDMDVNFSACTATNSFVSRCGKDFMIETLEDGNASDASKFNIRLFYCPAAYSANDWNACKSQADLYYTIWLDRASVQASPSCTANTDKGTDYCEEVSEGN